MRRPHQILAFPYKIDDNGNYVYGILRRVGKTERWQGIAGGVEDNETFLEACRREANEEANIGYHANIIELKSISTIPVSKVTKNFIWGNNTLLIYEHCFGIDVTSEDIQLSHEHTQIEWLDYERAIHKLTWDSNKNALWELNYRLTNSKNFICKIATIEEISKKWDYEIANHPTNNNWSTWKSESVEAAIYKTRICFHGILNNQIITEATAIISANDKYIQNKEDLVNRNTAYLTAFRTNKEYQGMGYFSKLYKFMENYLYEQGFINVTLGVEPCETKNIKIYLSWGYDQYIKTAYEIYSSKDSEEKIMVNYYQKKLK